MTHRCHNRSFLLKFIKDRNTYRNILREALLEWEVSLLNYDITCNHVHLLVNARETKDISQFMQQVEGRFAQFYNRRKKRKGAYWEDRYHATMIETGQHLRNCLCYIDLNMVRAGAVNHPNEWKWTGYHELMGKRQRYCLLDLKRLLEVTECSDLSDFRRRYKEVIEEALCKGARRREAMWTESIAVGSEAFINQVEQSLPKLYKPTTDYIGGLEQAWVLREG